MKKILVSDLANCDSTLYRVLWDTVDAPLTLRVLE